MRGSSNQVWGPYLPFTAGTLAVGGLRQAGVAEAREEEKGTDRSLTELVGCVNGLKRWKKGERKQSWTNPKVSELRNRTQSGIANWSKGQSPQDQACVCV